MHSDGFRCIPVDSYSIPMYSCGFLQYSYGFLCNPMDSYAFLWSLLDSFWIPIEITWIFVELVALQYRITPA